jgi:hypothetical protein
MKLIDLNVLLYVVNEDAAQHASIRRWWENALSGDETLGLTWSVLLGFLRLTTSPRIFAAPIPFDEAAGIVDDWLSLDIVTVPVEKPDHWPTLRRLLSASGVAGNLTTDAHLAALAMCHDAVLVSCDHDFARFRGLRREDPLGV